MLFSKFRLLRTSDLCRHVGRWLAFAPAMAVSAAAVSADVSAAERVDFVSDVRPILSDNCFKCHGPDPATREADLRLDTLAGLTGNSQGSAAVIPGSPAGSELIRRVLSVDPDEQMPPPDSHKQLSARQQQVLQEWIEQGAQWEQHWAFVPPQEPIVPGVETAAWCRNEIDRFVLSKLEQAGLSPAEEAPANTLLRRLYLDLIGLPPTPEEADQWIGKLWPNRDVNSPTTAINKATHSLASRAGIVSEKSSPTTATPTTAAMDETAYQELVTHLLNSPHYGERWGRRWLDLARYADTNGYEKDRDRSIWPYRDWVVNAFNTDIPFDQFTIEQLAGDMLPGATPTQRIATGFHRNTMLNEEGGIDPLEFRFHAMTDRVATTGTTWLGLTLGCCQCHTHKYDPVTHTEYYQVMALLNNADEPSLELPELFTGGDVDQTWHSNQRRAAKLLEGLPQQWPLAEKGQPQASPSSGETTSTEAEVRSALVKKAFGQWLKAERANSVPWTHLRPVSATSNLPILTIEAEETIFASGDTAKRDEYVVTYAAHSEPITALRLEALPDERLPARGPGSTYYEGTLGDFYLVELSATASDQPVAIATASESYAKNRYGKNSVSSQLTLDGDVQTGWSVDGRQGERHVAVYLLPEPLAAGSELTIRMTFGRHFASSLGRFRFSAANADHAIQARAHSLELGQLLRRDPFELTAADNQQLFEQFLLDASQLSEPAEKIRQLQTRPEVPSTLVFAERPADHPRPTFRHHRGEYLQPAEQVKPGIPTILSASSTTPPNDRLAFAKWLVSEENPLTARVTVNRLWATLFGTGIVATLDDFGLQGAPPSHPELLDWLALRFTHEDGWSRKQLLRRIVSSRTYRQASQVNSAAATIDPSNRLLSYSPRYRLDAEVLRDSLLAASGLLNPKLGGPPVRPPQVAGITEVAFGSPKWEVSAGDDRYRRSLYTFVKRTAPFAMTSTFDAPSGEACIARRSRSNSPLQALTLLNDQMIIDFARGAGQRHAHADSGEPQPHGEQLIQLFRSVLVRPPSVVELRLLDEFWRAQRQAFEAEPELAKQLADNVSDKASERPAHTAAWIATARALFALDETQTRE